MIGKIRKDDGENAQSNIVTAIGKNIVGAVVAGIFTVICVILTTQGNIKVEQMKQIYGIILYYLQNDHEQCIYSTSGITDVFGIEYVQYEFKSEPIIAGYHMIAYPYVVCEKNDNKVYLPITGQLTQDEYVADENGYCCLLMENTTEDFLRMAESVVDYSMEAECLVAVQYVKDGEEKREVYDVRDGPLTLSDQNIVVEVLKAWEDENGIKIDMRGWPCFDQKILEGIFD